MKFLLDQNLPASLVDVLAELGHEAKHIKPLGMAEASDREVWAYAVRTGSVMVSKDSDFVTLAGQGAQVVRLRIGNASNAMLFEIIRATWPQVVARLNEGETLVDVHA